MNKTLISLATASLIATTSMAADKKGIDFTTTGQAVIYYETSASNQEGGEDALFRQENSQANIGIQLNNNAYLGDNFSLGSQLSYLGTAGLEKNVVGGTKQGTTNDGDTTAQLALTKLFITKKLGNTTIKMGRQELPKSLSPLAYSEGWNVFKNTFDATLALNSDIPDTLIVAAYVAKSTGARVTEVADLTAKYKNAAGISSDYGVAGTAYMLTVQNKSIPATTLTASYYNLYNTGTAMWLDIKIAGSSFNAGIQAGTITPDVPNAEFAPTTAIGLKASMKFSAFTAGFAFTTVDGAEGENQVAVKNVGTGIKSPLYTQAVYNQDVISLDADTIQAKFAYNLGTGGDIILIHSIVTGGTNNLQLNEDVSYNETDLMYKLKSGNVKYFAALVLRKWSEAGSAGTGAEANADADTRLRFWARKSF